MAPLTDNPLTREHPAVSINLKDQYFHGPERAKQPYASISILNPIITIERHACEYYFSCRFNIETTILGYETKSGDYNEYFFRDICLRYHSNTIDKGLVAEPESNTGASFSVANKTTTTSSGTVGATLSHTPSGNVSLGLTRGSELAVSYATTSWSLNAHSVVSPSSPSKNDGITSLQDIQPAQSLSHQWFWSGNQEDIKVLTPDLKHSVKRHVVVTRKILAGKLSPIGYEQRLYQDPSMPLQNILGDNDYNLQYVRALGRFPYNRIYKKGNSPRANKATEDWIRMAEAARSDEGNVLRNMLQFNFTVQIRVKRRHGRMHRFFVLSGNPVKAAFLKPTYEESFRLGPAVGEIEKLPESGKGVQEKSREGGRGEDDSTTGRYYLNSDGESDSEDDVQLRRKEGFDKVLSPSEMTLAAISASLPRDETIDIAGLLETIKKSYEQDWSILQGRRLGDVLALEQGAKKVTQQQQKQQHEGVLSEQ